MYFCGIIFLQNLFFAILALNCKIKFHDKISWIAKIRSANFFFLVTEIVFFHKTIFYKRFWYSSLSHTLHMLLLVDKKLISVPLCPICPIFPSRKKIPQNSQYMIQSIKPAKIYTRKYILILAKKKDFYFLILIKVKSYQ